jgi:Ca2+-binding RTX toxin-like protein
LEGEDIICGGKGNDVSYGDPPGYDSDDEVFKSKNGGLPKSVSADLIFGQEGTDTIYGGAGNDLIQGGIGDDSLYGHDGVFTGGEIHNDGNDLIDEGPGDDSCHDHQSKTYLNCEYTDSAVVK